MGDSYKVTGVATQGGDGLSEWVTSYKLQYSVDGSTWQYYAKVRLFLGQFTTDYHRSALKIIPRFITFTSEF